VTRPPRSPAAQGCLIAAVLGLAVWGVALLLVLLLAD
jgi:hypothetical protein